ncbi:uncharacterized protein GGS22DRAFT_194037 [Annulohypoxylon maeteangense]|uniref:uncharacterized protein n=1 Tax=Annulohypoxylon maeteangense TaxID=1927788 RepID=UPI002007834F|nr:uncharacterized protein GGS22DRAFT_194037 [Annulohypoxylon maeteangense]KAI0889636.1 hypothetical protein GGS22DRAFT_194037 [Annulohypoxylon maeteangense]
MDSHELQTTSETQNVYIERYSPFSPYVLPQDSYPGPKYTDDACFNQKYVARAASTPLTSEELGLVRSHLEDMFYEETCNSLRYHPTFLRGWARNLEMASAPRHQDCDSGIMHWSPDIRDYANKQTAVYFVGSGSEPDSVGHRHGCTDRRLGCYIYRTWYALHGGRPNLQRQHFFAKALRVPKSEAASWSISGLVATHRRLCDVTAARFGAEVVSLRCEDPTSNYFPPPVKTAQTWCEHGLSLGHLFRAVILVADENVLPVECPVQPVPDIRGHNQHWKVAAWLERLMPECSVLMVRTGDDAHLSQPISFERLVRKGETIPLGLEEEKLATEFGVVRVKIGVAMRYLFDLQVEEEAAIPSLRQTSAMLTEERERACHAWVESVLQHASLGEVGVDGNWFTWDAVRRMWAERNGDIFNHVFQDETELMPLYSWYGLR